MKPRNNPRVLGLFGAFLLLLASCAQDNQPNTPATSTSSTGTNVAAAQAACVGMEGWPSKKLEALDTLQVDSSQFISADVLKSWAIETDKAGLRATANKAHDEYIDRLAARLRCAGVQNVYTEDVPITRWEAKEWGITISSNGVEPQIFTAGYAPYSGTTPAKGVTAPLIYLNSDTPATAENAAGKIVVYDVPQSQLPLLAFAALAMGIHDPVGFAAEAAPKIYNRPFLNNAGILERLEQLESAGAAGAIAVLPVAHETAYGNYTPYEGDVLNSPTLYVGKEAGARLKQLAQTQTPATLTLTADIAETKTRNLFGVLPGVSNELTVVNSHTDGTNYIEDNGPDAIIGMAQYMSRLPQASRPRSMMFMLSAGHFTGGRAIRKFIADHQADGLIGRIASIVTIEHLGAKEWEPDANGVLQPTGKNEPSATFMPQIKALADATVDMYAHANVGWGAALKPQNPDNVGKDGKDPVWPGEGQYFYQAAKLPTANYITGPYYLLNWGVDTVSKTDFDRMRKLMIAFTQMQLNLSTIPKVSLAQEDPVVVSTGTRTQNKPR